MPRMMRVFAVVLAVLAASSLPASAQGLVFRISTENTVDHVQTRAVARFASELERRAGGRLAVSHHFDATLFRDRDVVKALRQGKVEMAVPGTWQLDRQEPSIGIFLLPTFYGRDAPMHDRLRDGQLGHEINSRIASTLDLQVLGRWIDLGFAHVFGVGRTLRDHGDLKGLRIRVAGGEANLRRLVALEAEPRVIPWPDLPRALAEGSVDGILTTYETVASAKLWEHGVTSVFEDRQYFPQYVPLVSASLWQRLPDDLKTLMTTVWEESVDQARREAAEAQARARKECAANGIRIVTPDPAALASMRRRLLTDQPVVTNALGIDPALVARAMAALGEEP